MQINIWIAFFSRIKPENKELPEYIHNQNCRFFKGE